MLTIQDYQQARLTRDPRFDGRFFIAVKSTGIFCRPICPAKLPHEENVEYFTLAQQAMLAGYRPCLRCRPDSAPHSHAWNGVDTTVNRALRILGENLHLSMTTIAEKLGISDRYLRQLFIQHIGLSPKQYQVYEQILFAKQLLQHTQLPIEHIADAAGFNDARRLQYNMQRVMRRTPKELRIKPSSLIQPIVIPLAYRPPYNWPHLRDFLARRAISGSEWVSQDSYARNFTVGTSKGYFQAQHQPDKHCFLVTLAIADLQQLKCCLSNIRRILDVDADSATIDNRIELSGLPAKTITPGIRIPGIWNTFEAGCRAILGQQISVTAAINLVTKLVATLGEPVLDEQGPLPELNRYFPTPDAVANGDLSFLGMPNSRRETLRRFAAFYAQHPDAPPDDWLSIKGIGPWTIAYANLRGLSQADIWLNSDLVIKKQLLLHNIDADKVSPWRSYLTFTLWSLA
ncbi:AraC family transcriptional regulator, regulatory protein of adaptative response [Paraglaciecola mesophila KMM 241]|uniref:AraC family transcriptional regulator, regulatory protein of adaptative response n=1 Tax=Paraglaciecola mesophila KMM 241 TaxID=1128912 RepID=K6Z795_9ALTE|nr:AlkA N-terminal domain-containing protein [Paraglaciecola mesophila]GAC24838.1 AraC family transcriptional regulator, regulatory protein of adaptative response [Paraglaciecola mesophila KMM 241]|tara:strand:+ start:1206 stop:2579 length:1374 start_codon:yes stop_codon:yes gene_type:complete